MTPDERLDAALAALPSHEMSDALAERILAAAETEAQRPAPMRRRRDWSGVLGHGLAFASAMLLLVLLPLTIALLNSGPRAELRVLELERRGGARLLVPWPHGGSFVSAADAPIARLGFDVGDGAAARAAVMRGERPRDALALYNAFAYAPLEGGGVALASEIADCPWAPEHRLLRVQIEAHRALATAAMRIEFDPANVARYRLVGGDAGAPAPSSRSVRAGARLVALFEIELRPGATASIGTLTVSSEAPAELALTDNRAALSQASADFRFTAALAELAQAAPPGVDFTAQALSLASDAIEGRADRLAFVRALRRVPSAY
jgi:hypothetical protein